MPAKKWRDIRRKLSPEAEDRIRAWVAEESIAISLAKVRELVGLTQAEVAERLKISQGSLSRAEASADPRLSTLRREIEAMGGEVEVRAVFGDKTLKLHV